MGAATTTRTPHRRAGWTLIECLLALAIMATVFAAVVPMLHSEAAALDTARPRIVKAQEARYALSQMTSALRQARAVTAASSGAAGSVDFLACDGTAMTFYRHPGSQQLLFGPTGSEAVLAKNCAALAITCYDASGGALALPLTDPTLVATVEVSLTVQEAQGRDGPTTMTTRAALERTRPTVVISEIMYKAPGALGGDDKNRWIELYNPSASAIDVGGWRIWSKDCDAGEVDTLQADALYSTGSTVIPPGGYAVVTDRDSELFREFLANGDFEVGNVSGWLSTAGVVATWGGAASGAFKAEITGSIQRTFYQNFRIDSHCARAWLVFRERIVDGYTWNSSLLVRVTNRFGFTYATAYSGPFNSDWTLHVLDVTPWIDRDCAVVITVNHSWAGARMWIDAVGVYSTRLPAQTQAMHHLWVSDNEIAKNISEGQVFLSSGTQLRDVVVFDKAWGGDDDGTTLSRTGPYAPSTEQTSWQSGPYGGTPGAVNP